MISMNEGAFRWTDGRLEQSQVSQRAFIPMSSEGRNLN
jgi:hypothetical protein